MLTVEDLQKHFPEGNVMPPLLECVMDFQNQWEASHANNDLRDYLGFSLFDCGDALADWLGSENNHLARHFAVFGHNIDGSRNGSLYGLWSYSTLSWMEAPVVYLDSGGLEFSSPVADSLADFLFAHALDDAAGEQSETQLELTNWLTSQCGLQLPSEANNRWFEQLPDFQEWFKNKVKR